MSGIKREFKLWSFNVDLEGPGLLSKLDNGKDGLQGKCLEFSDSKS